MRLGSSCRRPLLLDTGICQYETTISTRALYQDQGECGTRRRDSSPSFQGSLYMGMMARLENMSLGLYCMQLVALVMTDVVFCDVVFKALCLILFIMLVAGHLYLKEI